MFFAVELRTPGVYVSSLPQGLFAPSELFIRVRKIALYDEYTLKRCADAQHRGQGGLDHGLYAEAVSLVRGKFAATCQKYGRDHTEVVRLCWTYGAALCAQEGASRDDMIEGLALLEDACKRSRRIFGADHQITIVYDGDLRKARARVAHFFPEAAGAP